MPELKPTAKKSAQALRQKRLHICFSEEEYTWLGSIAELEGVNLSGALRMLIRNEWKEMERKAKKAEEENKRALFDWNGAKGKEKVKKR